MMKSLRPYLTAALVVLASAAAVTAHERPAVADAAKGPSAKQIAKKIQAFYNSTKTYEAKFKQLYKVKAYKKKKRSTGRVYFQKPGKMSWKYSKPNGNRIVSDGKTLKVYEKDNNQLFVQPVKKSQYPAVLSFLMGKGDLSKAFKLRKRNARKMKFEGGYVLEGKPRKANPAYQRVFFYVDGATSQVRRVIIVDAQGNQNRFTFYKPIVNKKLPKGTFVFKKPKGAKVVHPLARTPMSTWP